MKRKQLLCLATLSLIALMPMLQTAQGESEQISTPLFPEALSGPVWLRLTGLDPRNHVSFQTHATHESNQLVLDPSTLFSQDRLVTKDVGNVPLHNEPTIAVNPTNPDNIIVGSHDYDALSSIVAYSSFDGGVTWSEPAFLHTVPGDDSGADPVLAFDRDGNAYYAYMSVGVRPVEYLDEVLSLVSADIVVAKSSDGGRTWSEPVAAAKGGGYFDPRIGQLGAIIAIFPDKPWMTVGPDPPDLTRDNIYVSYSELAQTIPISYLEEPYLDSTIRLAGSFDGGVSFLPPVAVGPSERSAITSSLEMRILQGSNPAVGPDGTLYVAYYDSGTDGIWNGIYTPTIVKSINAGQDFTPPVTIAEVLELENVLQPTRFRAWSSMFPILAIEPEGQGNIYAVFAENPSGPDDSDIMFSHSTDGGATWSSPTRVNDDETTNDQFFPWIAVGKNGTIHTIFGDRRDDPSDINYHVYYASSTDDGVTFTPNQRISDAPSNPFFGFPDGAFIGDYFNIAVSDKDIHVVWTDSRTGARGLINQDILTARLNPLPPPAITLNPQTGAAGLKISISGENFASNRPVDIQIDGVKLKSAVSDRQGRLNTTLIIPTIIEGNHILRVVDVLGNCGEANFKIDFGFDTIGSQMLSAETAIKGEVTRVESKLDNSIANIESSISTFSMQLGDVKTALNSAVKDIQGSISTGVSSLQASTETSYTDLKTNIESVNAATGDVKNTVETSYINLKTDLESVNAEVAQSSTRILIVGALAAITIVIGFIGLRRKPS